MNASCWRVRRSTTSTTSGRSGSGPGERRERSTRRFLDVVLRDFGKLVSLNLLLCACGLPSAALYTLVLVGVGGGWVLAPALVAGAPLGGAVGAAMFCLTQLLRREPVEVWFDFRRKFTENWRPLAAPGIVLSAFVFAQLHFWAMVFSGADVGIWGVVLLLLSFCVVLAIAPYIFLQVAYLDAGIGRVLVNALILSSSNVLRTCAGLLSASFAWIALALFLPVSLVLVPAVAVVVFPLTLLANLVYIWPVVDKQFGISDELSARRARAVQDVVPLFDPPD